MAKPKRAVAKQRGSNGKRPVPKSLQGKGFDAHPEHINRKGRLPPKDVVELNKLIDEIAAEMVTDASGNTMEKLRVALNRLLLGKTPAGIIWLLERRYGKVPQPIVGGGPDGTAPIPVQVIEIMKPAPEEEEPVE